MTTRYLRCILAPESEWLTDGRTDLIVQYTGPSGPLPDGPHILAAPNEVLKCSDDLATDTMLSQREGLSGPPFFEEIESAPAVVDIDVDALIAALE